MAAKIPVDTGSSWRLMRLQVLVLPLVGDPELISALLANSRQDRAMLSLL